MNDVLFSKKKFRQKDLSLIRTFSTQRIFLSGNIILTSRTFKVVPYIPKRNLIVRVYDVNFKIALKRIKLYRTFFPENIYNKFPMYVTIWARKQRNSFNRWFQITVKYFTKPNTCISLCSLHGKNTDLNQQCCLHFKREYLIMFFFLKTQNIVSHWCLLYGILSKFSIDYRL